MRWTEVEALGREGLIEAWVEVMGKPPPKKMSQGFMRSILAYDLQAREYGDLKPGALKRIKNAGHDGNRSTDRKRGALKSGGRLIRDWNGVSHIVDVTEAGFVWQGSNPPLIVCHSARYYRYPLVWPSVLRSLNE